MAKTYNLEPAGWYFPKGTDVTTRSMGRYMWVYNIPEDFTGNIDEINLTMYMRYGSISPSTDTYYTTIFQTFNAPQEDDDCDWVEQAGYAFLAHGGNLASGLESKKKSYNGITRDMGSDRNNAYNIWSFLQNVVADTSITVKLSDDARNASVFSFTGSDIRNKNAANLAGKKLYVITYNDEDEEYDHRHVYAGIEGGTRRPRLSIVTDGSNTSPDFDGSIGLYVYRSDELWKKVEQPPYVYRAERGSISENIQYPSATNKMTVSNATSNVACSQTFTAAGQEIQFSATAASGNSSSSANWLWYAFNNAADDGSGEYFRGSSSSSSNTVTMNFSVPIYEASLTTLIQSQSSSWRPSNSTTAYTIVWYNGSTEIGRGTISGLNTAGATKTISLADANNTGITKVTVTGTYLGIGEFTYNFKLSTHNPEGFNSRNQAKAVYVYTGSTWQLVCGSE